ncbi:PKD domain-containing protein [bacterium]|nr:PKD domain-containing protein [bacterium]
MRRYLFAQLLIPVMLILGVALSSCGSGAGQPGNDQQLHVVQQNETVTLTTGLDLGPISDLDRGTSYTDEDRLIPGADFATGLPNSRVVASGNAAVYSPEFAPQLNPSLITPAYGIYVFNLGDYDQEIQLIFGVSDPPASDEDLHYAIANYVSGRWDWYGGDGSRTLDLADYGDYISPEGHIFFAVVMTGLEQGQVDFVRIGTGFAPTGTVEADTTLGPWPLTVNLTANFTDSDGELVEWQWDFDNNGTIDETTDVPTLQHEYAIPGTYVTRVHAIDNEGMEGTNFLPINVTGVLPPNPPVNVQASDGNYGGKVFVSWDDPPSGIQPKGWSIERADSENGTYVEIGALGFAFKSYNDTSVTDQTTYWYRVRSLHDTAGISDPSETDDGFMGVINPPTGVICGQGLLPDRVSIGWEAPTTGFAPEGYDIFRSPTEGGLKIFVASVGPVEFYQDTSVPDGKVYYYYLQSTATDFPGGSEFSESSSGFVSQLLEPTGLTASDDASPTIVTLNWTHSGGSQVPSGYNIYRSDAEDGSYAKIAFTGFVDTFDDTTATDGEVYYYKVSAFKPGWDESPLSDFDSGFVGLSAPQSLNASDDQPFQVTVTWLPPALGPAPEDYEVFRADIIDGTYVSVGTTATTAYVDTDVVGDTGYFYYAVSRKTGYLDSPASNIDDGFAVD